MPHERSQTAVEAALKAVRHPAGVLLVVVPVVSWLWIVVMARDMYGPMTGAAAWMMTATWDMPHLLLLWAMWAVMMTGMMLPSASSLVLLYGVAARRAGEPAAARRIYALGAGYLTVWSAFSLGATVLQRLFSSLLLLSPMMEASNRALSATLLVLAGAYQMTPLKLACLRTCQSPLAFLISHWRPGPRGAFRIGVDHGMSCVGCCWALMLLLFAGGVMNLAVIAALTVFVAFEKLAPFGQVGARVSGLLLVLAGGWILAG